MLTANAPSSVLYRNASWNLAVRNRRTFHLLFVIRRSTIYVVIVDIREEVSARARARDPKGRDDELRTLGYCRREAWRRLRDVCITNSFV